MRPIDLEVKKIGNSIGVIFPAEFAKEEVLLPGRKVRIFVMNDRAKNVARDVWGAWKHLNIDIDKAKEEMRRGWK